MFISKKGKKERIYDIKSNMSRIVQAMLCISGVGLLCMMNASAEEMNQEQVSVPVHTNNIEVQVDEVTNQYAVGLQQIDQNIYFIQEDGTRYSGWKTIGEQTFYFNEVGELQTGECVIQNETYLLSATGEFITGWYEKGQQIFYKDEYGYDKYGLLNLNENLYYVTDEGLQIGSFEIANKTYITDDTGKVLFGDCIVNGKISHCDQTGVFLYGWIKKEGKLHYIDENGMEKTGLQQIDGEEYYFCADKSLLINGMEGLYQADETGKVSRLSITIETLDGALAEILQQTGTDIASIGSYVKGRLKYKYMDRMNTREEMAVYALNNRRCSCYYYEALYGLLLERAGYQVITINGEGQVYAEHYWSLVYTQRNGIEGWYHTDALKGLYVKTDAEMVASNFRWIHENFPATPVLLS